MANGTSSFVSIGRYQVGGEIGRGGMAVVYRARDPHTQADMAIKLMAGDLAQDPYFRKRFQREADVLSRLRHPGIVGVVDFGEHDSRPYLVMPYVGGGTLAARLDRGPMSPAEIAATLPPLADALDYAHVRELVHRDIKPSNILFDDAGRPRLTDFGIVKVLGDTHTSVTRTGTWLGTPDYMSPEQVHGIETLDGRSDIYALGVVLFEMLTGRLPFENTNPIVIAVKHLNEPPPRLRDVAPALAAGWQPILDRALAKSPEDRYPSASAMAADVLALTHVIPSPPPRQRSSTPQPTPKPSTPRPAARRAPALPVALAALAVVVLGGGALWALRPDNATTPPPSSAVAAATIGSETAAAAPTSSPARPTSTVAPMAGTFSGEGTIVAVVADTGTEEPRFRLTALTELRAGPGTLFATLAGLKAGEEMEVIGRDELWAWYNVRLDDGRTGWVLRQAGQLRDAAALSSIEPASTVPVPQGAATPIVASSATSIRPAATVFATSIVAPTPVVVPPTAAPPISPTWTPWPTDPPQERPTDPPLPTDPPPPTAAVPSTAAVPRRQPCPRPLRIRCRECQGNETVSR